jgi:hypothetical protein
MSTNESDIFEENNLYINGNTLYSNIYKTISEFNEIFDRAYKNMSINEIDELHLELEYVLLI